MVSLFGASSIEAIAIPIERQTETWESLQLAPVSTLTIVFGKSLAGSAFGIMLSLVTALGAILLTGTTVTNPLLFAIVINCGSFRFFCSWNVGCLAAKDMPTANISLTALRLPMIFISGVFMPIQAIPLPLRVVSYLTPLTYLVEALREAVTASSIMFYVDIVVLLTWFIVLQSFAVIVLNKRMQF